MAVETLGIEFVTAGFAAIDNQLKTLSGKIDEVGTSSQKTGSIVENTLAVALGNVLARAAETAASALLKMGQAAIGAVASAGKAVLDFGVEATLSAARVSEMSAVLNLLGERAGWTKGAIDENVEAMRNLGIRTDVAIDTLAAFARENLNAADALMVARVAQDLAVLSGRDSSEVLGELIYGIQTQNSGLQVFSDLGIQAGAAMDTYAKSMTKTVEVAAIVGGRTAEQNQHLKIAQSAYKSATAAIYKHNAGLSVLSDKALANAIAKQSAASVEMARLSAITGTATTVTKTLTGASKGLTKELTKSERMQAMLNAVRERGATIEGVYATAMEEPGKALRSLPRHFYEATISIGEHFLPVLGHVVEAITGFIKSIREMLAEGEPLNKMFAALGKLGATLAKALGVELGNGFEGLVDAMIPAIERVTEIIDAIRAFFLLAQNGFTPLEALGAALRLAFGEEVADRVMGVFDNITEGARGFGDWWAEHGPSITQTASELFGKIQEGGQRIAETIMPMVNRVFERFSEWFAENGDEIANAIDVIGKAIGLMADVISNMWVVVAPILEALANMLLDAASVVLNLIEGDWSEAWQAAQDLVTHAWEGIQQSFVNFADWVLSWFGTTWAETVETWQGNWEAFKEIVSLAWERIKEWVAEAIDNIAQAISDWATNVKTKWDEFWKGIETFVAQTWENIKATVLEWLRGLFEDMGLNLDEMVLRWSAIWNDVLLIVSTLWELITGYVSEKLAELQTWLSEAWTNITTTATEAWGGIYAVLSEKAQEIYNYVTTKIDELKAWLLPKWGAVKDDATDAWSKVVAAIKEKAQEIYKSITGTIGEIKSWLREQVGAFVDIGRNLIEGMRDGILQGVGALIDALTGAIQSAIDAALRLLGERSPSVVFRHIGENVMFGFAQGIEKLSNLPALEIRASVEKAALAIAPLVAATAPASANSSVTNNYYNQPAYNLTTQSTVRAGGLQMEFAAMSLVGK